MIKYTIAFPYFPEQEIEEILNKIRNILEGKSPLSMGPYVKKFEDEFAKYIGSKYAIATNSCTSALEIALRSIGLKEGDEVVVPVETFIATGSSVVREKGKIVFAEIEPNTFCLSLRDLKNKVSNKTKAVIVVHMAGLITPDIWEIKDFCKKRGIFLIEDAAHAHGAMIDGVKAGNIGDIGCFSFYPTKIMTSAEGGMITTNNEELYKKGKSFRNRGIDVNANVEIYSEIGSNNRMSELHALLGLSQLKHIEKFISHRNKIAKIYNSELEEMEKEGGVLSIIKNPSNIRHSYWRYIVKLSEKIDRNLLRQKMLKKGIAIDWPYDPPLHLQPVFKKLYGTKEGMMKRSEQAMKRHVCLPIHLKITEEDAMYIVSEFKKILKKNIKGKGRCIRSL